VEPEDYVRDAEAFTSELNREQYLVGAGLKTELELDSIFRRHVPLFEGERFDEAKRWGLEPVEERYLADFIATGYIENQTRALTEQIVADELAATVEWDGHPVPYRMAPPLIANEADAVRRHALERLYLDTQATFNPTREERERRAQREARNFGYPDYVTLYDALHAIDLDALITQMDGFIADTTEGYLAALDTYLGEMRILRDDARKCDLARIFRSSPFDASFPQDRMVATLHSAIKDLGMNLEEQGNIHLDVEPRPLKSPRAFCAPIHTPGDVRLVLQPMGGEQDYETLFHEAGHAEHFGNVDRTLSFPYRCLGDAALTESYAFLLEHLLHDPMWLRRQLGVEQPKSFLQLAGFHRLYFLRRYGTKLGYERELHRADDPTDFAPAYDELFTKNLGVGYGPESYLADVDDAFYAAEYVKAWIFEAQLRRYLLREFDDEWYRNPKAGRFLLDMWHDGQRHPVAQLARFMGYAGLDPGPVREDIRALLEAQ
jgi:oligoendopeptidase F